MPPPVSDGRPERAGHRRAPDRVSRRRVLRVAGAALGGGGASATGRGVSGPRSGRAVAQEAAAIPGATPVASPVASPVGTPAAPSAWVEPPVRASRDGLLETTLTAASGPARMAGREVAALTPTTGASPGRRCGCGEATSCGSG